MLLEINAKADGDEEPSQRGELFMDAPTLNVIFGISRLSIIEHAPPVVSSEMLAPSISTLHSAHDSVGANLDTVPFENFNPTHDNESEAVKYGVVKSSNLESDNEMQHEPIVHGSSEGIYAPPDPPVEASTTETDTESLTPVPDSGRAALGVHTVQETTNPSNTFNDELEDVARGVFQGLDLGNNQQASTEKEAAIVPVDSQQTNDIPLDHQFPTFDFQAVWNIEPDNPTGAVPDVIPSTTQAEQVLEGLNACSGVASNDGQLHIPPVSIWSRRPYSIPGDIDIPEIICELYGEGVLVQARRTRGFPHPYRMDGRIRKSFVERRRRIMFNVSQAPRTAGRADIHSNEKTIKRDKKPSDNDSNKSDGVVGSVTADVRLGEAFEPPHAVDDVANFM